MAPLDLIGSSVYLNKENVDISKLCDHPNISPHKFIMGLEYYPGSWSTISKQLI